MNAQQSLAHVIIFAIITSPLYAEVDVEEFTDADAWQEAVGSYQTIDFFEGGEPFSPIGDDYVDEFGITFVNAFYDHHSAYENDLWGFWGPGGSWLEFDEPQMWIAADHPGTLHFDLYLAGELIYSSNEMGGSGAGNFSGLVSSQRFDEVYLYRVWPAENLVFVDDLHFGTIPAPGALGLFVLATLFGRSRRRTFAGTDNGG